MMKRYILGGIILVLLLTLTIYIVSRPSPAQALDGMLGAIFTEVKTQIREIRRDIRGKIEKVTKISADVAFKNSLRVYLGKLAEDTATWVASAGTGQKPLFITNKSYFSDLAQAAGGEFIDTYAKQVFSKGLCEPIELQKQFSLLKDVQHLTLGNPLKVCENACNKEGEARNERIKFMQANLTEPKAMLFEVDADNLEIQCMVNTPVGPLPEDGTWPAGAYEFGAPGMQLRVAECVRILSAVIDKEKSRDSKLARQCLEKCNMGAKKVSCSASTAWKNLKTAQLNERYNVYFSDTENDIAQIVKLSGIATEEQQKKVQEEKDKLGFDFVPTQTTVSEEKTAPGTLVKKKAEQAIEESSEAEKVYTGSVAADVVRIFTNTLSQKLTQRFFNTKCGLNPAACKGPGQGAKGTGLIQLSNVEAAQLQFGSLGQIDYISGDTNDTMDVFQLLRSRGLKIDSRFEQAVNEKKTLKEAIDARLVDPNKTFGFDVEGNEPADGYPYRLILYLRHYRVVPVGWELAAEYIQKFDDRNIGLGELMNRFDQLKIKDRDGNEVDNPYYGLIDPNWVLKLPSTYCRRQGSGEETISRKFVCDEENHLLQPLRTDREGRINCGPEGDDIGRWVINRNTDYCADEQSCIAEDEDGSCRQYGYCFAEKRVWRFNGTSCPNYFASCTAFTNPSGQSVAYLTNTVDGTSCTADNAGCQWFCKGDAAGNLESCTLDNDSDRIYFDRDVQKCSQSAEGCSQFLRTIKGANLLANNSFEDVSGTIGDENPDTYPGWVGAAPAVASEQSEGGTNNKIQVKLQGTIEATAAYQPLNSIENRPFTLSFLARSDGNNCKGSGVLTVGGNPTTANFDYTPNWTRFEMTGDSGGALAPLEVSVKILAGQAVDPDEVPIGPCTLMLDSTQLEEGSSASTAKDYGGSAVYMNKNRAACAPDEIGCELYTPLAGGLKIPGIVTDANRCDADKVGCKAFKEMPSPAGRIPFRDGQDPVYLIPSTGRKCSARAVGCEEYTNLNKQAAGGEAREFFTAIKQCVLPQPDDPNQTTYFSWTGSETQGFQLKSYLLFRSNLGDGGPCTNLKVVNVGDPPQCEDTAETVATCDTQETNPDCTEFFNDDGDPFVRLRSRTINVTATCFPARNTIDQSSDDPVIQRRLYMISPNESVACSSREVNCREYKGNAGNNVRTIFNQTFEQGAAPDWQVNAGGGVSNESTAVGGHSLRIPPNDAKILPSLFASRLVEGRSYTFTFWAKAADAGAKLTQAYFDNGEDASGFRYFVVNFGPDANVQALSTDWQRYTFGPLFLDRPPVATEGLRLVFADAPGGLYLDNVMLREAVDSVYLIKGSARLCEEADQNCEAYRDRANQRHYLTSFSRLCGEDKVGCEQLIDTKNSTLPREQTIRGVTVPADSPVALVVNPRNYCSAQDKGCQGLGDPQIGTDAVTGEATITGWDTAYLKNDPDNYSTSLCTKNEDRCVEFSSKLDKSKLYFRDPGERTCSYERPPGFVDFLWVMSGTSIPCPSESQPSKLIDACEMRVNEFGETQFCYRSSPDNECIECVARTCDAKESGCNEYRDPSDPANCRADCPLELHQGKPQPVDAHCRPAQVEEGGFPGCQSYTYLKQSVESSAGECGSQINLNEGCRPFYDTSNAARNFRSQ